MVQRIFRLVAVSILLTLDLSAQTRQIIFDSFGIEHGLSEGIVLSVVQDRRGFLWFATADGLNRFDGYSFTTFRTSARDSFTISSNYVNTVYEDRNGNLWIGSTGGLDVFDPKTERFHRYNFSPLKSPKGNSFSVIPIFEDSDGAIWIGILGGGLTKLVLGTEHTFPPEIDRIESFTYKPEDPMSISNNQVSSIGEDDKGNLWVGTWEGGLNMLNRTSKAFMHFRHEKNNLNSLSHDFVRVVYADVHGALWVGTEGGGLDRIANRKETGRPTFTHYRNEQKKEGTLSHNVVRAIHEDKHGNLWIGTDGGGIDLYDRSKDSFVNFRRDAASAASIASNRVVSIYEDPSGSLWFGTWGNGVSRFSPAAAKFRNDENFDAMLTRLTSRFILALYEDSRHRLWIGTHGGGLNMYDAATNSVTQYVHELKNQRSLINNVVWSITEDKRGDIWMTTDQGVERLSVRDGTFSHFQHNPIDSSSLSDNFVSRILADRSGLIWILAPNAVNKLDPSTGRVTRYPLMTSDGDLLPSNTVSALYEDRAGELWLGIGGLARFDMETRRMIHYKHSSSDSQSMNVTVSSILQDRNGAMWVSTFGSGVYSYDTTGGQSAHYSEKEGLPNDVVYGILEDARGFLWMSTNRGLSKFDPVAKTFKNYDVHDGLQSNEFNRGAYLALSDGRMMFGGINGINRFFPDSIRDNTHIPPVVLTSFKKFDEVVQFDSAISAIRAIVLNYKENFFSFEFASLDYAEPSKNLYMYMLDGLEQSWSKPGTRRSARYTNVDPGEYVFRVRGSNNDGTWNTEGIAVRVTITPPFWRTWWFSAASVFAIAGVFGGSIRYISTRKLKRQLEELERERALQQERERISRDLHDHVGAQLVNIISGLDLVGKYSPPTETRAQRLLQSLQHDARSSILQLRETIWAIKTKAMTLDAFAQQVENYSRKQMEFQTDVQLHFESDRSVSVELTPVQVLNCFRIIQEALTNCAKHANAENIWVKLRWVESGKLVVIVKDDGVGVHKTANEDRVGNGLLNMKRRADELGGTLHWEPTVGTGMILKVEIPIAKP
ncbi:MAG: hypothetical protein HY961_00230 [Ignavibacteriae bacterium]|nr:hypothetical protein [Ignavibacteriota bacterium]